jgi:hypothetical protein
VQDDGAEVVAQDADEGKERMVEVAQSGSIWSMKGVFLFIITFKISFIVFITL